MVNSTTTFDNDSHTVTPGIRGLLLICAAALTVLTACATSHAAAPPRADTPATADRMPPPPPAPKPVDTTLGERLGRLDAAMKTATRDSIPILQARYDSLLEQNIPPSIRTGREDPSTPPPPEPVPVKASDEPIPDSGDSLAGPDGLLGFRKGEIAGTSAAARAATRTRHAAHRHATEIEPPEPLRSTSNASTVRDARYVNGIAAAQSGKYAQATKELPAVVAAPPPGKRAVAQQALAQSLEKTGNTAKAAEQYRLASQGSGEINHKSYLSYCRLLASQGQRDKARMMLVNFINKYPKSPQIVEARQLLQML